MVSRECAEKSEMCSLITAGLSRQPHPPLARNLPSYTSIIWPGVWKFSATVQENRKRVKIALEPLQHLQQGVFQKPAGPPFYQYRIMILLKDNLVCTYNHLLVYCYPFPYVWPVIYFFFYNIQFRGKSKQKRLTSFSVRIIRLTVKFRIPLHY